MTKYPLLFIIFASEFSFQKKEKNSCETNYMISKVPTSSTILQFYESRLMKIMPKKDFILKSRLSDSSPKT